MDAISQTTFSSAFSWMKMFEFPLKFHWSLFLMVQLTHWGRVTHICVGNLTIIYSDNGLSPGRRQAIIWTNAAILLIGPLGINFNDILAQIITFSFKKMYLKVSSAKWRSFCLVIWTNDGPVQRRIYGSLGLNELRDEGTEVTKPVLPCLQIKHTNASTRVVSLLQSCPVSCKNTFGVNIHTRSVFSRINITCLWPSWKYIFLGQLFILTHWPLGNVVIIYKV